jgi:hypothetical protein
MSKDKSEKTPEFITEPTIDEFKGSPYLKIPTGGGFHLGLGLRKLSAVMENWKACQAFVESGGKSLDWNKWVGGKEVKGNEKKKAEEKADDD